VRYNIPFEGKYFVRRVADSSVFYRNSIGQYTFFAAYFYHYFVSKYLSDNLRKEETKKNIANIYNNLHIQANAYIGIFLVHHSKDISLIEEVLLNTMLLYDDQKEIELSKDEMRDIDEFANKLNAEIIEAYDRSEENRHSALVRKDSEGEEDESRESEEIKQELAVLHRAMRTIEVVGHILKNHSGEIERVHLKDCYINALNAYRRICNYFVGAVKKSETDYVEFVIDRIQRVSGNGMPREEIIGMAHQIFTFFNLSAIFGTIKRSADALGSKGMMKIISEVSKELDNPFAYCVYLQCEMWYKKELPIEEAAKKYKDFPAAGQYVIQRLLKEFTDLHHVDYKAKQQIASAFKMKIQALDYDYEK
jgi:hypothetical protein